MNYRDFGKTPTAKSDSGSFVDTLAFGAVFLPFMPIVGAILIGMSCGMKIAGEIETPKKTVVRSH